MKIFVILGIFTRVILLVKVNVQYHIILYIAEDVPEQAKKVAGVEDQNYEAESVDRVSKDQNLPDLSLIL